MDVFQCSVILSLPTPALHYLLRFYCSDLQLHCSLKHLSNIELNKVLLCSVIQLPWAELQSKLRQHGLSYAPAILPFPVMFKVYNYVPDNELPYLTFEKCQCYASFHASTRKAAFLWKEYAEMQLGAGPAKGGCWNCLQTLLKALVHGMEGWGKIRSTLWSCCVGSDWWGPERRGLPI